MLQSIHVVNRNVRLLAVASGGGHWEQLVILRDAFADADCLYVTTVAGLAERDGMQSHVIVTDCNKKKLIRTFKCFWECFRIVSSYRPDIILSTGAAPGLICVFIGRFFGAKTIWIDSVANANRLSLSGRLARLGATVCLTQWPHLDGMGGARYRGSVL
jgi:UDP-N-acetylglucosamine:LPS N-acetylglucosamine transferase